MGLVTAALGRFREALHFDELAVAEIQRAAKMGHKPSQEDIWIYHVNRGRLYLSLGRIDEAEPLLCEGLPHTSLDRRIYRMFAEDALKEIEQRRQHTPTSHYQLDWWWIERYRELDAFDAYWWWIYYRHLSTASSLGEYSQQRKFIMVFTNIAR